MRLFEIRNTKPAVLYHGSTREVNGPLKPILQHKTEEYVHDKPAVFATARKDLAAMFMFPMDILASIGIEDDVGYICIWGKAKDFEPKDKGGFLYILPSEKFKKIGKEHEWQAFEKIEPVDIVHFPSVIDGMIACGVQVYFIDDNKIFDKIREEEEHRKPLLKKLKSENQKRKFEVHTFESYFNRA